MDIKTQLIHNPSAVEATTGAASPPIYRAATYLQAPGHEPKWSYSRVNNPTRQTLEETLAELEQGSRAFAFASGMAAISAMWSLFSPGDHVIVSRDLYGGTHELLALLKARVGLDISYVDLTNTSALESHFKPTTRAVYVETPSNPTLKITDLAKIADLAHRHQALALADNTFMSPYLQRPLSLGFDLVAHSATKFLGGHSDLTAGVVVSRDSRLGDQIKTAQTLYGGILSPDDSWLLMRGMKTLAVRIDRAQQNAIELAEFLSHHPAIARVFYPGLSDHPGHNLHRSQAAGPGAMMSVELAPEARLDTFFNSLQYALYAVSLGGVETIVSHPATMSHAPVPEAEREAMGISSQLVRISVGIEASQDLQEDFGQALKRSLTE